MLREFQPILHPKLSLSCHPPLPGASAQLLLCLEQMPWVRNGGAGGAPAMAMAHTEPPLPLGKPFCHPWSSFPSRKKGKSPWGFEWGGKRRPELEQRELRAGPCPEAAQNHSHKGCSVGDSSMDRADRQGCKRTQEQAENGQTQTPESVQRHTTPLHPDIHADICAEWFWFMELLPSLQGPL